MGRDCARQKALLHCEHEGEEAVARLGAPRGRRRALVGASEGEVSEAGELSSEDVSEVEEGGSSGGSSARMLGLVRALVPAPAVVDLISIMVLLLKQVHLQNVGDAGRENALVDEATRTRVERGTYTLRLQEKRMRSGAAAGS